MDRTGTHPLYRGEVDYKLFDKIPLQLFERNIFYTVFVFEERGKPVTAFAVIVIARIGAVFAHTFEEPCKVFVEGLQQQAAGVTHTEEGVANLFGRDIRITVAEPLILFADIGFDVLQLFIEALGFEALPAALFALASQREERTVSLQLNCDIVPLIVIRPITGT